MFYSLNTEDGMFVMRSIHRYGIVQAVVIMRGVVCVCVCVCVGGGGGVLKQRAV